tara:strand:+ start:2751 stop:3437 length:687 start_codon:yes stop_codon:yes gene_type:complete
MKIDMISVVNVILLKENSDYRYRGLKFNGLKSSIKKVGVMTPISVGSLNGNFHVADGNRRTTACRELGIKHIPAIIRKVNTRDALQVLFMENTKYTHPMNTVQQVDMVLKGMNPQYVSNTINNSIKTIVNIYGTKAKAKVVLRRMVNINKSPRSYVIALENLENYLTENDNNFISDNTFRKKVMYWMLNHGSPWQITNTIKLHAPTTVLTDAINNNQDIPDDWWINVN